MSLDITFHDTAAITAEPHFERHSQWVDLTFISTSGKQLELAVFFNERRQAEKFASLMNLMTVTPEKTAGDIERIKAAVRDHRTMAEFRAAQPRPAGHADAFAIEDDFQRDYDEERQHGWALCGNE